MADVYDITNWPQKSWISTGGTREKRLVENPENGKIYFFKESIERFPPEFWSEIISSKVGQYLGFNVLDYNVGIIGVTLGCICESMIDQASQELDHGVNLLKDSVPSFKLTDRPLIGFDEVSQSFQNYKGFIEKFIEIMVFDAIIGNQDRHSENWAIIRSLDVEHLKDNKKKLAIQLYNLYKSSGLKLKHIPFKKFFFRYMNKAELVDTKFAPIYDSGSSLGRDIHENNIHLFLENDSKIQSYINKGASEIRWTVKDEKINHFEILKKVKEKHSNKIEETINNVLKKYKKAEVWSMIEQIDKKTSIYIEETKLSLQRKKLIAKFIDHRVAKLNEIL